MTYLTNLKTVTDQELKYELVKAEKEFIDFSNHPEPCEGFYEFLDSLEWWIIKLKKESECRQKSDTLNQNNNISLAAACQ